MDFSSFLDCRLRGNDIRPPASLRSGAGLSTARGEVSCFIRLKCYLFVSNEKAPRKELSTVKGLWQEYKLFWQEVWQAYHTTGAILPSSRSLARALARYVGRQERAQRILEVGPGTGAVTRWILARMRPEDRLDLVELNQRFVAQLQQRFDREEPFRKFHQQIRIFHAPVQEMGSEQKYDVVISGLPLNNFHVHEVQHILEKMFSLLKPGGVLSFFEYIGIRRLRALVAGKADRQRLRGIGTLFQELFRRAEVRRDWVWLNVPPAWVHHLQPLPDNGSVCPPPS